MVFTAAFIFPFFLLLQTEQPVLVVLALVIATALGWAPVIAVQPAYYAELFGARVRYSGFATSREIGAAVAGFTPLIASALVATAGGAPWMVAAYIIGLCLISLIAFVATPELKDMDITAAGPAVLTPNR
jgi:MHS family shikimate/dehydroshikimate transporter-like MFS transporter